MRRRVRALLALVIWITPLGAFADGATDLEQGLALFADLEYQAALPKLAAAKDDATLAAADRARAALHIGMIQLSLGDKENAERNFDDAVRLYYDVALPAGSSPNVVRLLEEARARAPRPQQRRVELRHLPPDVPARPVELVVEVDPTQVGGIGSVALFYRKQGTSAWSRLEATHVGATAYSATLASPESASITEYFFEAYAPDGSVVGQVGSAALPLKLRVAAEPAPIASPPPPAAEASPPFYTRAWFLGGVGAVVVGGAVAAVLLMRGGDESCGSAGYGCVGVTVHE